MKFNHSTDKNIENKLKNTIKDGSKVVVYGAASGGLRVLNAIENTNKNIDVVCMVDNDMNKQGNSVNGVPVKAPSELNNVKFDQIIIAVSTDTREIENELTQKGLSSFINIFD